MSDELDTHFLLRKALGFPESEENTPTYRRGTGQHTSFRKLGLTMGGG